MLFDWQKKIIDKFFPKTAFGLFVDMGLGKTPLSLAFAEQHRCTKVIVITINAKAMESVEDSGSWLNWASKSNISWNFKNKHSSDFSTEPELLLINYEALFKRGHKTVKSARVELRDSLLAFIKSCKNQNVAIIVDESHKTKSLQSQQTISIIKLQQALTKTATNVYTYLLTGTPFTTGYIDLYTQLKLLGCNMTKGAFEETFCEKGNVPGLLGWQQPIVGYKNITQLFELVHRYAITIKSDDVIDLPEQIFVEHTTNMSEAFKMFIQEKANGIAITKYAAFRGIELPTSNVDKQINNPFFRNIAYPDLKWLADTTGTFWLRARQLSIGFQGNAEDYTWYDKRRIEQVKQFLETNEDNYLIFYNYTPELFELYQVCEDLDYNIDVYCGECKSLVFYEKYAKLKPEEKLTAKKKNVILANFASGSTGMNWQAYNKCIIFSIPLYKDYEQGIKRIHRTGQKETTIYHIFSQQNWLDKNMRAALDKSIQYSNDMFEADLRRVQEMLSKASS